MKVEVEPALQSALSSFSLVLRNGRRIESGWTFREAELTRLIRIVEAA